MKIYVDENESPYFIRHVHQIYGRDGAELVSAQESGLLGMQDIPLFDELRDRGFCALITRDRQQLRKIDPATGQSEADKLLACGLHWIGHSEPAARGVDLIAELTSLYLAQWPGLVDLIAGLHEPSAIIVKRSSQRALKAFPLRKG